MNLQRGEKLKQLVADQLSAVDLCFSNNLTGPGLILIYCAIDFLASLERANPERVTRRDYIRWIEDHLRPEEAFSCTPLELYGARCGVVHTMTSESDSSRSGEARQVVYAFGNREVSDLDKLRRLNRKGKQYFALHVNSLLDSLRDAAASYIEEISNDATRSAVVDGRLVKVLQRADTADMDKILDRAYGYQENRDLVHAAIKRLEGLISTSPASETPHFLEQLAEIQEVQAYCNELPPRD